MKIVVNNSDEVIKVERLTVSELLKIKNFTFRMLVVKINGKLIRKDEYDGTVINDGDDVMVLHLVSGG
jgi:thiamine biosynthesis protein ThiS